MDDITYDSQTALVVVDVQNDFADSDGSLYVSGGEVVVSVINGEIQKAKEAGASVLYTADWHPESTPHFAKDGEVVRKGIKGEDGYSGFTTRDPSTQETVPTELSGLLRERGVTQLVVCGLATDYCVKSPRSTDWPSASPCGCCRMRYGRSISKRVTEAVHSPRSKRLAGCSSAPCGGPSRTLSPRRSEPATV